MTHIYTRFGDIVLPLNNPVHDISTGEVDSALVRGSNGRAVNYLGTIRRLPSVQQISIHGVYHKEQSEIVDEIDNNVVDELGTLIIAGDTEDLLRNHVLRLRAQVGKLAKLYLKEIGTTNLRWKDCRLLKIRQIQDHAFGGIYATVDLSFETAQPKWKKETITTSSNSISSGTTSITVVSEGEDTIDDAVITVNATGSSVTLVRVKLDNADFSWAGTLLNGNDLVIDTGKRTIKNDGDNAYSGFSLHTIQHLVDGWFQLQPGSNQIEVTVDTACDFDIEFYDQWT